MFACVLIAVHLANRLPEINAAYIAIYVNMLQIRIYWGFFVCNTFEESEAVLQKGMRMVKVSVLMNRNFLTS